MNIATLRKLAPMWVWDSHKLHGLTYYEGSHCFYEHVVHVYRAGKAWKVKDRTYLKTPDSYLEEWIERQRRRSAGNEDMF